MRLQIILLSIFLLGHFGAGAADAPYIIRPGEVRVISIAEKGRDLTLTCRDYDIKIQNINGAHFAVVAETHLSDLSSFECLLKRANQVLRKIPFKVEAKSFESESLTVNPKNAVLSPKNQRRVEREKEILRKVFASYSENIDLEEPFSRPLKSKITSPYGIKRVYNGELSRQHLGVDFRAMIGSKIRSTNRGQVAFTGKLFNAGNIVVLDHGYGVFTTYSHLSKILVKKGDLIKKKQLVGLSGNTGRVNGPHLHWSAVVHGLFVDGLNVVSETEALFHSLPSTSG